MRPPIDPPRILVTRTDRIGDLVLSTPVFEALRKKFPDAWIACVTFPENRALVEGNLYLDEVILYDKKGREKGWLGNLRFAHRLAQRRFDCVIHLHATNRMHLVTWLAGIPERIGWDRRLAWALTRAYPDRKREGRQHEAQYNFTLLGPLGVGCPERLQTYFPLKDRDEASLGTLLARLGVSFDQPWIVVSPSASCPSKRWPAGFFAKLMEKTRQASKAEFFVIGTLQDRPLADQIRRAGAGPFYDLTGRLSLGLLAQLLRRAALLVSNDSGPVHLAGAVGTPVVSIFGRKQSGLSVRRWGPLGEKSRALWKDIGCPVCLAHRCEIGFLCLEAVSVEEVLRAAAEIQPELFLKEAKV